jgi:hypothetical protein
MVCARSFEARGDLVRAVTTNRCVGILNLRVRVVTGHETSEPRTDGEEGMLLALLIVALLVLAGLLLLPVWHGRRTPRELRGDWWSQFETDFRDYAQHASARRRSRPT